jgi:hypothetical protein
MRRDHKHSFRRGTVLVFTVLMMIGMLGMLALAVDIGYVFVVDSELQRTADAAALAAAWDLIGDGDLADPDNPLSAVQMARATAVRFTGLNRAGGQAPLLAPADTDVGRLVNFGSSAPMDYSDPALYNAVRVRVGRTSERNGEVGLFFAKALGIDSCPLEAEATAAFVSSFRGFRVPSSGENLNILPFALDQTTWDALMAGNGGDDWTWDAEDGRVVSGDDDVLEVNLFPQGTGSPGNRGTVDIGSSNNSTNDIKRQILEGISQADLDYIGGKLEFNDDGKLYLNGDTGISAAVKAQLEQIKGQPRIIPIFSSVTGPGNNAEYTIVAFVGVRIMEVKLTGSMSSKRVIVQPAQVFCRGGIPDLEAPPCEFVYSPVWLVR